MSVPSCLPTTSRNPAELTAAEKAHSLTQLLDTAGQGDYIGEAVSQLAHSLQCAQLALQHDASDTEVVVAALLHDIGQFLPGEDVQALAREVQNMQMETAKGQTPSAPASNSVGRVGHEAIGAAYLAQLGFPRRLCALVGSHVAAKRYLCAVDPGYHATLSEASQMSLKFQGGPMREDERRAWEREGWCEDMCRLRKWDDAAKVVGLRVRDASTYEGMMVGLLSS